MEKITYPPITHKYITLFDDEGGYNTSYPTFEEVNWSDIDYPEERPKGYRLSRRLSNMYHKDNPPQYKFDNVDEVITEGENEIHPDSFKIATYNSLDDIRKTFFLEIVWGYYGWEWLNYTISIENPEDLPFVKYYIQLEENGMYMTLSEENGVFLSDEPYALKLEEVDGNTYITDGTLYVGLEGTNDSDMSSDPSKKIPITVETMGNYTYFKEDNGYIGSDYKDTDDVKCYANKGLTSWNLIATPDSPVIRRRILEGGNLYKIKELENVPSIIDGYRLQHINDFLNSLNKVINVEGFDTSNLVAANRAFKRIATPTRRSNTIPTLYLQNAYDINNEIKYHYFGYGNTLNKLEEADLLFYNGKTYIIDEFYENQTINIPNITHIDKLCSYGYLTNTLKFNLPKLELLTNAFRLAILPRNIINVNEIFVGDSLKSVKDLSYMFMGASLTGYEIIDGNNVLKVKLDLTNSSVPLNEIINLTRFLGWSGNKEYNVSGSNGIVANTILDVDLNFNNKVNLDAAFADIMRNKNTKVSGLNEYDLYQRNGGFLKMHINLNGKERFITSIIGGFYSNTFIEPNPIQQVPNNECDDKYIYRYCTFNSPVTYNFKNGELSSPRLLGYGLFNDVTFNNTYHLENVDALDRVEFYNVKFGADVPQEDRAFPYIVQNLNDHTYRYFDLRNSKFTSIPNLNIYIDTVRFRTQSDKLGTVAEMNPFAGCSELEDLSGIHLYYSDLDDRRGELVTWLTLFPFDFRGMTKMTKTPHIHFNYFRNRYMYSLKNFTGLRYLTDVNLEYLSARAKGGSNADWVIGCTFKDCTSLVNIIIATETQDKIQMNLDVRGCISLDIPTLQNTILNAMVGGHIECLESTWKALNNNDLTSGPIVSYCKSHGISYNYTQDSSYKFPDWL